MACARLAMIKEGVKQPRMEDYASLTSFLLKMGIDTSEMLCFKDTSALNHFYTQNIGIPDSRFFNQHQDLVDYRQSPQDCNGMVAVFLEHIETIKTKEPIANHPIGNYLQELVYVTNQEPFHLEPGAYDLYLIIYWAKYLGKINKHKVFDWLSLVEAAQKRNIRIRVIKIDADYQKAWNLTREELPHFKH